MTSKSSKQLNILALVLSFAAILTSGYSIFKQPKVAYIDTNVLLEKYNGMKEARKAYQVKADKWQSNLDTLKVEVEQRIKAYEADKNKLSSKERKLTEELITTKRDQYLKYQKAIGQQAQQEDQKLTEGVLNQTNAYLIEYGKEKGYTILFGANGSGTIVYGTDAVNITEEVLEGLNKEYEGS